MFELNWRSADIAHKKPFRKSFEEHLGFIELWPQILIPTNLLGMYTRFGAHAHTRNRKKMWYLIKNEREFGAILKSTNTGSLPPRQICLFLSSILVFVFPPLPFPACRFRAMHARAHRHLSWLCSLFVLAFSVMNWKTKFHFEDEQTEEELNYGTNIAMHLYIWPANRHTDTHSVQRIVKIEIHKQTEKKSTQQNRKFVYINELRNSEHVINVQWPGKLISVLYTHTHSIRMSMCGVCMYMSGNKVEI